jgi:hypothetical protein
MKDRIVQQCSSGMYGSLDVLHLKVFKSSLQPVEATDVDAIKDFSSCLESAMRRGKHWFLNPFFQRVASSMQEGQYLQEALLDLLQKEGKKETQEIDETKNYVKISMDVDILVTNAKDFLDDPSLNVESASVQTDFFRIPL